MLVERRFDTGEVVLNYAEGPNNGPPLVLFPGVTRRWQSFFMPIINPFINRTHIYAVDHRGHGKSSHKPGQYRLNDFSTDAATFLQQLDEPAIIFGHSLGGMILPGVINNSPKQVRAAIFGDPPLTNESLKAWMTQPLVNDYNNNIIKFKEQGLSIWEIADRLGGLTPSNLEWARSLSELDISVSEVMLQYDTLAKGYDVEALMKSIMCPVLLLQGDPSTFSAMRDEDVEFVKSHLSQVVHVKLDGIGHGLGLEEWKAKQVISAMHHFLEAIR